MNMESIGEFFFGYLPVYVWVVFTSGINIIAPISASTVVNPVTTFFTDPQRAIGIGAFTFFLTGLHRVYLFRKEILSDPENITLIRRWLPYSIVGALIGGFLITSLNEQFLAGIIIVSSGYFIIRTIRQIITGEKSKRSSGVLSQFFIFTISGFLQGSGMQGADMRNNYLRTFVSEVSVRAVGSVFGLINFFIAGSVILFRNHLLKSDIVFIATLIPFLIVVQAYGVKIFLKIKDRNAKILAVSLSCMGIFLLVHKYFLF